ncbi:hypothetical protein MTO96_038526, partial [Rhipicephalus appendiculatus]
ADTPSPDEAVPETLLTQLTLFLLVSLLLLPQRPPFDDPLVVDVDLGCDLDLDRDLVRVLERDCDLVSLVPLVRVPLVVAVGPVRSLERLWRFSMVGSGS